MESLNVIEYVGPEFVSGAVPTVVGSFTLEHAEESLAGRIVATVADGAH